MGNIETKILVTHQGAIQVNDAYILKKSDEIAAVSVDLKSKYAIILSSGVNELGHPTLAFCADEKTLKLFDGIDGDMPTEISFPEFEGWNIWITSGCGRYTAEICFLKN